MGVNVLAIYIIRSWRAIIALPNYAVHSARAMIPLLNCVAQISEGMETLDLVAAQILGQLSQQLLRIDVDHHVISRIRWQHVAQ
jgi:hypothetical protein